MQQHKHLVTGDLFQPSAARSAEAELELVPSLRPDNTSLRRNEAAVSERGQSEQQAGLWASDGASYLIV